MMVRSLIVLLASVQVTFAAAAPRGHGYIQPGPTDVRSPCPGLNALANHGFIPRSGRNMTLTKLVAGGKAGMNMGADFMTAIGSAGILSNPDPLGGYFDLNHLAEHDFPIEHDGSLSRQDAYFGDWYSFNQTIYSQWMSVFGDAKTTTIRSAAKAKYARIQDSLKRNPQVVYGPREFILSYGETALYLQTMGMNTTSGVARLSYVRSLFEQERLPYHLGWSPGPDEVTLFTLGSMIIALDAANKEALPEGLEVITEGIVRDAFAAIDPVTGKVLNITEGLLSALKM